METQVMDCGHTAKKGEYGKDSEGKTFCYSCCADQDRAWMDEHGKIDLYLTLDGNYQNMRPGSESWGGGKVTNWPGSLEFKVGLMKVGKHNLSGRRYDVWFRDHRNNEWHGVTYGDFTQICHCQRLKR